MASKPTQDRTRTRAFTTFEVVKGERIRVECPDYVDDSKIRLSENSRKVLERRYLRKDYDGTPLETPAGMFYRVAHFIAQGEEPFGGDVEATTRIFYDLLTEMRFFPNSPTFTGAGTPLGQLAACFTAQMRVTTDQGLKPISQLQIGDRVLTHRGRFRPVTQLFRRSYEGSLLRIKVKLLGTELEVTPEHPILTPDGWVQAGALQPGDWIAIGQPQGVRVAPRFDLADTPYYAEELEIQVAEEEIRVRRPSHYQNSGRQARWGQRFIELTPALARLCGYYVAEGTIGPEERYVRFTFHTEESEYQRDVQELVESIFGIPVQRTHSSYGQWISLSFYSRAMSAWFRYHFGSGSADKRIPLWLQYATPEIQEAFLIGLLRGDGMYFEKTYQVRGRQKPKIFRSLRVTLSNPSLVHQLWQMCLRLGYDAAIRPVDTTYVTENARPAAQISMPPLQSRELIAKAFGRDLPEPDPRYIRPWVTRADDQVYFQIERIEEEFFSGTVYNCEVDEDHTYVTEGVVVHNCFVLPIEDDMGKESPDGIFNTLRNAALIQQTGGGNGFSFSRLRPKGDVVRTSAGRATGPVGFLRVYDQAFGEIAQGGSRRGANMGVLRVDHPDIEDFITCKAEEGTIVNFNISVAITDEFMRAVQEDREFELRNPRDGSVWRTVRARDLFKKIVHYAHRNGEPGALFIDAANRTNPVPHLYELEATNPCGEQWLGPYENCCLGSINLGVHVTTDAQGNTVVDWERLRRSVREATHFLDNVVTQNAYVPAVPQLREAAMRARRIGLGIMGLGDLMYKLRIRYGSEEGQEFAAQIMEFVRYHAMQRSIELARERGPFPAFPGSIYDPNQPGGMKWKPPRPLFPYTRDWGRPELDWDAIVDGISRYGLRNAAQTTVAPTGTIGTVSGCEGYGCEPVFALGYIRHFKDGDRDVELLYTSPLFQAALDTTNLSEERKQQIKEDVVTYGTCQHIDDLPEWIRHTFVVSQDITAEEHVRMQAAIQAFVDNSISKCVTGDTLVLTPNGLIPIQEMGDLRLPDQFEPLDREILSPEGREKADAFYYGGFRETRKVALEYGFSVEGTPNHRIHVLDRSGNVVFRTLEELKPGDTVVLYSGQQAFGPGKSSLPPFSGAFRTSSKPVHFPQSMSRDLAFFLGCLTSEGAITQNGVVISSTHRDLLEELQTIARRIFGLQGHIAADARNSVCYLQLNSRPLRHWLLIDLGLEAGAEYKRIPTCILQASEEEIGAFLRGLFLDAFMTQNGKTFGITVASQTLVRQLQVLLLNCGILATARRTAERAWSLTVQGAELERLAEMVEFVEVWKNDRLARRRVGRLQRYRNYSRLLPPTVTAALQEMCRQAETSLRSRYAVEETADARAYQRVRVNLLAGHRLERQDARRLYESLRAEGIRHPFADAFFAQDNDEKVYVQVTGVEVGFAEVFDISVPGSHSFIANGLGNHNTINFPEDATEEDVAKAYQLAWELGCKGITVYVTGSRQEVVLETKAIREKKAGGDGAASPGANGKVHTTEQASKAGTNGHQVELPEAFYVKRPRPHLLRGTTYRKDTPLGTAYITVNSDEHGEPFEVFVNIGKAGSDVSAVSEAIGRLISLVLRMPSALPPAERLRWVMDELAGIGGGRALGFGAQRVRSLPDGIAQVIAEYLKELPEEAQRPAPEAAEQLALPIAQRPIGDLCPECGEATFLNVEGCRKCAACGYSEC